MNTDNTIFDDVFKTLLEKMPHLVIPLINEVFHTAYDENHGREYAELAELMTRISDYIFREKEKTRKGVREKMGGKVLELEVDKAIDKAYAQGIS